MKKLVFIIVLLHCLAICAQNPQLSVNGADSTRVKMNQMLVEVKIIGNIAYTTAEMHFSNKTNRQMEAELLFPLPEGVSVSRYAIDINGKMRDAVPVEKSKGKQVFEAIEHRRVDPGLLEKVDGNNFKTRIYPIIPNGERIVIIGYEQELSAYDKNNLAYTIVSKYPKLLDKFSISIEVVSASTPEITNENEVSAEISLQNLPHSFRSSFERVNYKPSEKLVVKIPIQTDVPATAMQSVENQNYFYSNVFVAGSNIEKRKPATIGLIWDVSLSCKNRDLLKELDLLDYYFKKIRNTSVTLYTCGYVFSKKQTYSVVNGDWDLLKAALRATTYDGGTRFSKIKLPAHDEYLFFSDGISTLSDADIGNSEKPFYTITSSVSSDFSFLNFSALRTGAEMINLDVKTIDEAANQLLYQNLKFMGIKENFSIAEMYPIIGTKVSGSFSVSGISLKNKNEIVLLFGFDDKVVLEKKITLDLEKQQTNLMDIRKIWAQKKISNLELQYEKNASEIEAMGRKYGIVTKNTSLIVLENIHDYVMYDIVPPAEFRAEFDRIMKQQRESRLAQQKSNRNSIQGYFDQLQLWWNADKKYENPNLVPAPNRKNPIRNHGRATVSVNGSVSGIITDRQGLPLPGVSVVVKGKTIGTQTDFDGKYTIPANKDERLEVSYIGYNSTEFRVGDTGTYNIQLNESTQQLSEVVVVAYGTQTKRSVTASATTVVRDSDENESKESDKVAKSFQGYLAGISVQGQLGNADSVRVRRNDLQRVKTETKSWSPDRTYLKILEAAPEDKKYDAYLELREAQENNPSFYFDVANYFYSRNERERALLILSNIADLSLENHQLYKSLTYVFRQWESFEDALFTAAKLVKWRKHEPQSHRDLALAFEDNKLYQQAFDQLISALEVNYYGEMSGLYQGVEDIILMDLNRLIQDHPGIANQKLDKKFLKPMPTDIRIVLNWNQMDTDIDLHVVEPTGEECYYAHRNTQAGARFSKDFTQGYGPEQYLLRNEVKGKFVIKTNYFGESALTENGPATVMVEVYTKKPNGKTQRKIQTIQLGKVRQNESLAEITIQ